MSKKGKHDAVDIKVDAPIDDTKNNDEFASIVIPLATSSTSSKISNVA